MTSKVSTNLREIAKTNLITEIGKNRNKLDVENEDNWTASNGLHWMQEYLDLYVKACRLEENL